MIFFLLDSYAVVFLLLSFPFYHLVQIDFYLSHLILPFIHLPLPYERQGLSPVNLWMTSSVLL